MRIEHIALWTTNLESMRAFYERYFGASASPRYDSENTAGFQSYFLTFPSGGARMELMTMPALHPAATSAGTGYAHVAITVGSPRDVDALAARLRADGIVVRSAPRRTGDGYYEAVVEDPDGNPVEITA